MSSPAEAAAGELPQTKELEPARTAPASKDGNGNDGDKAVEVKARPEREASFKDYLRIFTYATKWDYVLMVVGALASIGAGITMPLMNVVFGKLVGSVTTFATGAPDLGHFQSVLNRQSLYIFALFIARFGLKYINKFSFRMIGIRMSAGIRLHYLQSLFSQTIHVLDSMPSGTAASTITATANTLQMGISEKLGTFIEFNATIVAAIIIAFTYSWSLTLVTASGILFMAITLGIILPLVIRGHANSTKAEAKSNSIASEAFGGIRMVTSCGAESRIAQKYSEWVLKAKHYALATSPLMATQFGLIFFSLYAMFALAFWYGTKSYAEGRIGGIGDVIVVLMSVMLMVMSLERSSAPLIDASKAMVAAAEFFAIIDAPRPKMGKVSEPDVTAGEDVVFSDVTFAYPSRPSKTVLDGLNLRIEANKNTAIVGPSGSGKSTIVGLIEGWYTLHDQYVIAKTIDKDKKKGKAKKKKVKEEEVEGEEEDGSLSSILQDGPPVELKGTITTCGHPLEEINMKWWRSQIGLVQQEPFLFNDSIFKNVSAGLIGTEWEIISDEEKRQLVKTACVESFADEFIDRLPDGYDTKVGEQGTKLSGGQRQRIAIARSIIAKPKILILDEATSAIDVRGERIVQAALERASRGRTTITIAHRLSTIKNADRIVVLQNGKVAEEGTHESLLANPDGVYYGLVYAQKLSLGDSGDDGPMPEEDIGAILDREKSAAQSEKGQEKPGPIWKDRNIFNGFGMLLGEQKSKIPLYILALIGAGVAAAAVPVQAFLFAKIITVFAESGQRFLHDSAYWSKMWAVLAACIGASYFVTAFAATACEHLISSIYRQQYFESLLYQKTSYFDQDENSTGQLTARLASDITALKELLGVNMMMMLIGILTLIGALAISFAYGWKLALVALCVTVPIGTLSGYYRVKYELQFQAMNEAVFQESSKFAAESIGAFRTVSSLVMEDSIVNRYKNLLDDHVLVAYKKARWTSIIFALSDSVSLACQALVFWYGGRLLMSGEYDTTAFFVTYMAVINGAESAGNWLSFGPNAAQASAAANRILNIRNTKYLDSISATEQVPDVDGGVRIEFEDVYFKYPTRDISIFKGLNLTIEKGQFAALVGASGSGKTSIVSLLERFYDVGKGRILFNGKDVTSINIYEYRKLLSLVAQEPSLFQGTIKENILLGVDPSTVTDEDLYQVCKDASIHDFIVSLPDGYNTDIGNKGVSLSGGQKQRVSIARALLRNPHVLILDEATSSLDSESEKLVQAALERVAKGRTTVAVAHRLATIQNADIIYVLGEGSVLESGSHAELLKRKGVYYHMCHNQALDR